MSPSIKSAGKDTILTYSLKSITELHTALEEIYELLRRSGDKYEYLQKKKTTGIKIGEGSDAAPAVRMEFTLPVRVTSLSFSENSLKTRQNGSSRL